MAPGKRYVLWPAGVILRALGGPHFAWPANHAAATPGALPPMPVHEVRLDGQGSTQPDPPFDPAWDVATLLRWRAGLVEERTGLRVRVVQHGEPGRMRYGLEVGGTSMGTTWRAKHVMALLIGIEVGAGEALDQ